MLSNVLCFFGALFILIGVVGWESGGENAAAICCILLGSLPYISKILTALSERDPAQRPSFWEHLLRFVALNPIVWVLVGLYCSDFNDAGLTRAINLIVVLTIIVQVVWFLVPIFFKRDDDVLDPDATVNKIDLSPDSPAASEPIHDPYYASSLAQAKIEKLEKENQELKGKLAYADAKILFLNKRCTQLSNYEEQYERMKSELLTLSNVNSILQREYESAKNANEALNSQIEELRVRASASLVVGNDVLDTLLQNYKSCPTDFEKYIAELYKKLGYDVRVTPRSNDGGIDVLMENDGVSFCVEVKLYSPDNVVGRDLLQKLWAAQLDKQIDKAVFVTTSSFSKDAIAFAYNHDITLIDGKKLVAMIKKAFN